MEDGVLAAPSNGATSTPAYPRKSDQSHALSSSHGRAAPQRARFCAMPLECISEVRSCAEALPTAPNLGADPPIFSDFRLKILTCILNIHVHGPTSHLGERLTISAPERRRAFGSTGDVVVRWGRGFNLRDLEGRFRGGTHAQSIATITACGELSVESDRGAAPRKRWSTSDTSKICSAVLT
jgi:hypothetical protein